MNATRTPRYPGERLTVVIRNDAPLIHCGDSPTYRSVTIRLTDEQRQQIPLRWIGSSGTAQQYEEISRCFIELDYEIAQ